ncbi:Conserved_hypothetical protein [Hexamita inflata]|uniref:Uncharacterized protein n=1 Tax=Hexamita inflata TaxID=28002 RepID=A0AA86QUK4_9EUKA|nr:Conserved hypothetical protein [Hexamita inflata]
MTVLFAHDYSGSTQNALEYHSVAKKLVDQLQNEAQFVLWDNNFEFVDRSKIIQVISQHQGRGSTEPSQIVNACNQINFSGELIILTDGEVGNVDKADKLIQQFGLTFTKVTVHIVNNNPNISVCAPFVRKCPHEIILYSNGNIQKIAQVTKEDRKVIEIMEDVETEQHFDQIYDSLHNVIQAATIGTVGDPILRDKVVLLRQRIVENKAKTVPKQLLDFEAKILEKNIDDAVCIMNSMYKEYYYDEDEISPFESKMSKLVNMCSGRLRNQFQLEIKSQRVATSVKAKKASAEILPEEQSNCYNMNQLLCPITLGESSEMVLLIKSPLTPLLGLLEKQQIDDCINNPLNAFKYPDFIKAIADHLDVYVSLQAYKQSFDSKVPLIKSPITGNDLCGALSFGSSNESANVTDYTIAVLLAGGKLMGNINLWFSVIYFIIKGNPRMQKHLLPEIDSVVDPKKLYTVEISQNVRIQAERLEEMLMLFEKHMVWRLLNRKAFASLSGLSQFVVTKMNLAPAIWHILHSCLMNLPTHCDSLRLHLYHVDRFLDLLGLVDYHVDTRVLKHSLRLKAMLQLLKASKDQAIGAYENMSLCVKALTQSAIMINRENIRERVLFVERPPAIILVDGPASEPQILQMLQKLPHAARCLPVNQISALFALVDPQLSASDIILPYNWIAPDIAPLFEWSISTLPISEQQRIFSTNVQICSNTARPYSIINNQTWQVTSETIFGPLNDQIHSTRWFGQFIAKYKFYPTEEEFLVFLWNRLVKLGQTQKKTLPKLIQLNIKTDFADHKELTNLIEAKEFAKRWNTSVYLQDRERMEKE